MISTNVAIPTIASEFSKLLSLSTKVATSPATPATSPLPSRAGPSSRRNSRTASSIAGSPKVSLVSATFTSWTVRLGATACGPVTTAPMPAMPLA